MTFWKIFLRVLPRRPSSALEALYWRLTGRKVRAEYRLRKATTSLQVGYDLWISSVEQAGEISGAMSAIIQGWSKRPDFLIVIYQTGDFCSEKQRRSTESLERQVYPHWTLGSLVTGSNLEDFDGAADYVIPLKAGNSLSATALFRFAEAINSNPAASLLYGDNDERTRRGVRTRPWFKPRWNAEMFLGLDYLSQAVAIEADLAVRAGIPLQQENGGALPLALLRAANEREASVVHVPHILCHADPDADDEPEVWLKAVSEYLQGTGATCAPGVFGTVRVCWPLPSEPPKVSIIIPTKDKIELLSACVKSILKTTTYPNYEIVIVNNNSVAPETLAYLEQIGENSLVRVLRYDARYNFSAINNFAAEHAEGRYLCLLNNDTEVVHGDWLTEMMRYAHRPDVGAVGAKLLYPDGTIQHAGVVVGMGDAAGHAHRFTPEGDPGYFRQAHVAQFATAVTAACLVIDKQKFEAVGGLDEVKFAIAYNDVDLCLKLQAAGFQNVYVPHAVLLHHETQSRGHDLSPEHSQRYYEEVRALQDRWGTKDFQDPLHNPNLDRYSETYVIRL